MLARDVHLNLHDRELRLAHSTYPMQLLEPVLHLLRDFILKLACIVDATLPILVVGEHTLTTGAHECE